MLCKGLWSLPRSFLSRIKHLSSPSFLTSVHACHFFPLYFLYSSLALSSSSLCCHLNPSFCFLVFFSFLLFCVQFAFQFLFSPPLPTQLFFRCVFIVWVHLCKRACVSPKKKLLCFFANLSEPEIKFQSLFQANLAALRSYFCIDHLN